jgi:hypothetical protein
MGDALIRAKHYVEFRQKQATPEHFASEVTDALARVLAVAEAAVRLCESTDGSEWVKLHGPLTTAVLALRGAPEVDRG